MNNRSLRSDTECDVVMDAGLPWHGHLRPAIRKVRDDLLAEHLGVPPENVAAGIDACGSLIGMIEALRGPGRSLVPYETPDLTAVETWLADHEVLDPEGPEEMFEPVAKRGLFRRFSRLRAARR